MATKKFWSEFSRFADRGFAEVTTSKFASDRIHPAIAEQLLYRGWAEREAIGSRIIKLTDDGKREAEIAAERAIANI